MKRTFGNLKTSNLLRKCWLSYKYLGSRNFNSRNLFRLHERGMYSDIFPNQPQKLLDTLNRGPQTVYAGFDPTADSLHVGNLLILINLMQWQRSGHKPIAVIGGATGQVGDPSGKKSERPEASKAVLMKNMEKLSSNIEQLFNNHQEHFCHKLNPIPIKIVNNLDWYEKLGALELISKVGRHFRLGTMLSRQSVKDRLQGEEGMSFTEFTYQILQAYDWLHLFQKYKCKFQLGGHDQLGNIAAGYELIKRVSGEDVYGLTLPLITTEEGDKLGKSAGNAIWLSSQKTSPFELYQFFVRVKDDEVADYLKLFTFLPMNEVNNLVQKSISEPEKRLAQNRLAEEITTLVHGPKGLEKAQTVSSILYERDLDKLRLLKYSEVPDLFRGANIIEILLSPGITVLDAAMKAKCFASEHDALRIIAAGGFYINYEKVRNCREVLSQPTFILPNNLSFLRVGKKNYTIIRWLS